MKSILKFGLIILKNKKILLNRKMDTDYWLLPGGKPEGKETPEECIIREVKEENNVEVDVKTLKHFGDFEDDAANEKNTKVHVGAYIGKIKGTPKPGQEIVQQKWFSKNDELAKLSPILKYKIFPHLIMEGLL